MNNVQSDRVSATEFLQLAWEAWTDEYCDLKTWPSNGAGLVGAACDMGLLVGSVQLGNDPQIGPLVGPDIYIRLEWSTNIDSFWRVVLKLVFVMNDSSTTDHGDPQIFYCKQNTW